MRIKLTSKDGAVLATENRYVRNNLTIVPNLQDIIVKENGEFVPENGYCGLGKITVAVPNSDVTIWDGQYEFEETPDVYVIENLFNVGNNLRSKPIIYRNNQEDMTSLIEYLKKHTGLSPTASAYYVYVNFFNSDLQLIIQTGYGANRKPLMNLMMTSPRYDLTYAENIQAFTLPDTDLIIEEIRVGCSALQYTYQLKDERVRALLNANIVQINPKNTWHFGMDLKNRRLSMISDPDFSSLVSLINTMAPRNGIGGIYEGNRHLCIGYSNTEALIDIKIDTDGASKTSSNFRTVVIADKAVYVDYPEGYMPDISRDFSDITATGSLNCVWVYDDYDNSITNVRNYIYDIFDWLANNLVVEKLVDEDPEVIDIPEACDFEWAVGSNLRGKTITIKPEVNWSSYNSCVTSTGLVQFGTDDAISGNIGKAFTIEYPGSKINSCLILSIKDVDTEPVRYIMYDGSKIITRSFTFPDTCDIIITAKENDSTISNEHQLAWLNDNIIVSDTSE